MFTVTYTKAAYKTLSKMPTDYRVRMMRELALVAVSPAAYRGDWKALEGAPYWRLRVGGYRAICEMRGHELVLLVLKVGSRGNVYK
ncbi:MAG: type II toxin-antitoxin system RelE/ParE family toxin [Methylococcaceae bacterium]|nr:MAG: type II toxin-antitoxin system RelE/ParE family toxin [Methylococcaceae bacterium]